MTVGEYFEHHHLPRKMHTIKQVEEYMAGNSDVHQSIVIVNAILYLIGRTDHEKLECVQIPCYKCQFFDKSDDSVCYERQREYIVNIYNTSKRESMEALL